MVGGGDRRRGRTAQWSPAALLAEAPVKAPTSAGMRADRRTPGRGRRPARAGGRRATAVLAVGVVHRDGVGQRGIPATACWNRSGNIGPGVGPAVGLAAPASGDAVEARQRRGRWRTRPHRRVQLGRGTAAVTGDRHRSLGRAQVVVTRRGCSSGGCARCPSLASHHPGGPWACRLIVAVSTLSCRSSGSVGCRPGHARAHRPLPAPVLSDSRAVAGCRRSGYRSVTWGDGERRLRPDRHPPPVPGLPAEVRRRPGGPPRRRRRPGRRLPPGLLRRLRGAGAARPRASRSSTAAPVPTWSPRRSWPRRSPGSAPRRR